MEKFYSARELTKRAIELYKQGTPMNPAGARGTMFLLTYQETDKVYNGKDCLLGDQIQTTVVPDYIFTVNKCLEAGHTPIADAARIMGMMISCRVRLGVKIEQETVTETTTEVSEGIPEAAQQTAEEPEQDNVSEEIEDSPVPTEHLQEDDNTAEVGEVDWVYAESLADLKYPQYPKVELDNYAKKFGVELDRRKNFKGMIAEFRKKAP